MNMSEEERMKRMQLTPRCDVSRLWLCPLRGLSANSNANESRRDEQDALRAMRAASPAPALQEWWPDGESAGAHARGKG